MAEKSDSEATPARAPGGQWTEYAVIGVQAYGAASYFLGNSLLNQGRPGDAAVCFQRALAFEPNSAEAHGGLGNVFSQKGQWNDAIGQYQIAVQLKPDFGEAYNNLGYCFLQQGKPDAAVRNGTDAVAFAEKAAQLTQDTDPSVLGALAAAEAEAGRFGDAVATQRKAVALAQKLGDAAVVQQGEERLNLYRADKACRQFEPDQPSK